MNSIDAYLIARTKRKTRRIRTALVVIVSSLLFAVLFFAVFVAGGLITTTDQVKDVGFNGRNLASVSPMNLGGISQQADLEGIEQQMAAELRARKIKVTDTTKQDSSYQAEYARRINVFFKKMQIEGNQKAEAAIRDVAPQATLYHYTMLPLDASAQYQPDPKVDPLVEELTKELKTKAGPAKGPGANNQTRLEFNKVEKDMLRTQVQPGQTLGWKPGEPYPLVISYSYLEKLANRSFAHVSVAVKNKGYQEMLTAFAGKELPYCYRNQTAQTQLRDVLSYNLRVTEDKDNKTNPITVPVCGAFDPAQLKKLEIIGAEQTSTEKPLFTAPEPPKPVTAPIRFKIVGYIPTVGQYATADIITQTLTNVSALPGGSQYPGIIPAEVVAADPLLRSFETESEYMSQVSFLADLGSREALKEFVAKSCQGNDCNPESGKLFIMPFGNIKVALEGIFRIATKFLLIAAAVIMVIAALMIILTISKVISDSTKEIAVFRSLGARRRDIAQIYFTYGLMLAGSSLLMSVIIAVVGAYAATVLYGERIEQGLIQSVGAYNVPVNATLLGVRTDWLALVAGALVMAALVGITIPVLASLRRKLITILREE